MIVLGYEYKTVHSKLYCLFKYSNGAKVCRENPVEARQPPYHTANFPAKPKHYYCSMNGGEEPPTSVQLSTSSNCEPNSTGGEIPVNNYNRRKPQKKFGVCIQGPLRFESLSDLIEYIEMSQLLGAELIVFYVNEHEMDRDVLEYILTHYADTVRMIGWKKFAQWNPMHYYGQLLIITDCLYQVMYEVEYLIMMDLDELLLPLKHDNWSKLVQSFPSLGKQHSTLKFQNRFYDYIDQHSAVQNMSNCPNVPIPKYLAKTKKYLCNLGWSYRTKYMSQPRLIYETAIHGSDKSVPGHAEVYNVPPEVAVNAHYRTVIPKECTHAKTVIDNVAMRFDDALTRRVCPHVHV